MNEASQKHHMIRVYCLLAIDIFSIVFSYVVAVAIRFNLHDLFERKEMHYTTCLSFLLFCAVFSLYMDWNRNFSKRGYLVELSMILKYNIVMFVTVGCLLFLIKQAEFFSRLLFGYFFLINIAVTFLLHVLVKKIMRKYFQSSHSRVQILLVVEREGLSEIVKDIKQGLPINYDISAIAVLDGTDKQKSFEDIPIIADRENLMEVARQLPLDEVFIKVEKEPKTAIRNMIRDFESMGVLCHYSIDIVEWQGAGSRIGTFGNYTVITYTLYNIDFRRRVIKRCMDIVGGAVGLLITIVLTPFIAIAIKLDSKGPVFFSQIRIGKNGRRFKLYKFRSMYVDAERQKKSLESQNEIKGLMFKMKNDPRITRVGKFIRKTSIDELPQFWNVLKGDMSLIGTRPPTEDEFKQYSLYYRRRLSMTPGLTGLWQVSGRSDVEDFEQVVKYDLEYIDNWSVGLDIKILLKTILVIFTGKGSV